MGRSVRLANEDLHVDVLPENGGRIASIRCRRTKTEFLVSGSSYETTAAFPDNAPFEVSDCAGWDECLPTVSLSTSDGGECEAPDHGDLWRHPWAIHEQSSNHIVLSTECFSRPLNFDRSLRLDKNRIRLDYSISNRGKKTEAFIYACHPPFAVDPGDRVLLPSEVSTVRLHSSRLDRIGNPGDQIHWPFTVPDFEATAIDRVGDISDGTAEMFYVESLKRSACALFRLQRQPGFGDAFHAGASSRPGAVDLQRRLAGTTKRT